VSAAAAAAHPQTGARISRLSLFKFLICTFPLAVLLNDVKKETSVQEKDIKLKNYVNLERIKCELGPVFI
jgi:hypothetical protein